jgi:hypothetical protein
MDDADLRRAFRNGWLLTAVSLAFVAGFAYLVFETNRPGTPTEWDMGGEPFLPASAPEAEGYYLPPFADRETPRKEAEP